MSNDKKEKMMKKMISKLTYSLLAMAFVLASCSSDDDYAPGDPMPAGAVGAYFATDNPTSFSFTEPTSSFTLKMKRVNSDEAATVPLVVEVDTAAIVVPQTVTFAKGEDMAELTVDIANINSERTYHVSISVEESQVDPYSEGVPTFEGTVFVGNPWKVIIPQAMFYYSSTAALPTIYSDICQYNDENRFRIDNFMGSGKDMEFQFDNGFNAANPLQSDGYISWLTPVELSNGYEYVTTEDGSYGWPLEGSSVGIYAFATYPGYSYAVFSENYLYFWAYSMLDDENYTEISDYLYGVW